MDGATFALASAVIYIYQPTSHLKFIPSIDVYKKLLSTKFQLPSSSGSGVMACQKVPKWAKSIYIYANHPPVLIINIKHKSSVLACGHPLSSTGDIHSRSVDQGSYPSSSVEGSYPSSTSARIDNQEEIVETEKRGMKILSLNGKEGIEPCMTVCSGTTGRGTTNWSGNTGEPNYAKIYVDIAGCDFISTPLITTTIEGLSDCLASHLKFIPSIDVYKKLLSTKFQLPSSSGSGVMACQKVPKWAKSIYIYANHPPVLIINIKHKSSALGVYNTAFNCLAPPQISQGLRNSRHLLKAKYPAHDMILSGRDSGNRETRNEDTVSERKGRDRTLHDCLFRNHGPRHNKLVG
eukprot:sb/3466240/